MSSSSPYLDAIPAEQRGKPCVKTAFGSPGELAALHEGWFVVSFGQPPEGVAREMLHRADQGPDPLARAEALDPSGMVKGLFFSFGPGWEGTDLAVIQAVQRRILHAYYRNVFFPLYSLNTPDPHGVRAEQDQVPELVRMISTLRNIPYLLRYPLADKLMGLRMGLPALLLLPGPSLKEIESDLPGLAERCLVICVSRTLDWCLKRGVEPDFVVQLDTFLVQQHLYADIPHLPRTTLVPISIAPVDRYAHKFRGCFFMDSFHLGVLPNPFRLRESHVSSLMACLGLAECLHAPQAFLVGADLSMPGEEESYFGSDKGWETAEGAEADTPLEADGETIRLNDAAGNRVHTLLRYLATAEEAETFARDIHASTGTRFRNLSGRGILSREWFPPAGTDEVMALAPLDRKAYLSRLDKGLAQSEDINLLRYKVELLKSIEAARSAEAYLFHCIHTGQVEEAYRHPLAKFMRRERDFFLRLIDPDPERLPPALRLVRVWKRQLGRARNHVQAKLLLSRGADLAVLCMPGEEAVVQERLGRLFPGGRFTCMHLTHHAGSGPSDPELSVSLLGFDGWISRRDMALLTEAVRREYDYFFEVRGDDKVLTLGHLLDDPPA